MHEPALRARRRIVAGGSLVIVMLVLTLPSSAHHGWSGYLEKDFQISGTVESPVSLAGPHASLKIRADDGVWDVVLGPRARTERAGLKEDIIPLGARVTVYGHRHRDAKKLEIKTERLSWNGRLFNVYPDRS
jgi:hypothetical protein